MRDASSAIMIRTGMLRTNDDQRRRHEVGPREGGEREEDAPGERGADRRREDSVEDRRVERRGLPDEPRALSDEQLAPVCHSSTPPSGLRTPTVAVSRADRPLRLPPEWRLTRRTALEIVDHNRTPNVNDLCNVMTNGLFVHVRTSQSRESPLIPIERRLKILERVADEQVIQVGDLARDFGVSEMTIRRDIRRLERDGFLRQTLRRGDRPPDALAGRWRSTPGRSCTRGRSA